MPATIDHGDLSEFEKYQLKATLHGLNGERDELRLEEIVSTSGVPTRKVEAVMAQLDANPNSPVIEVSDGVWWITE